MTSSQENCCGHRHMCFIYSSSFTAVTQSSMARAVCRQMWLISPQLSFKGQLTACPGGLVGMLWAQLNHRDRKMLPQECSCRRGRQIPALLPSQRMNCDLGMLPFLPEPWLEAQISSKCSIHHLLETSKSGEGTSVTALPSSCHRSQHPRSHCGMSTPALSTGAHNNSLQSQKFLLLAFPVCPSLMSLLCKESTELFKVWYRWQGDKVWVQNTRPGSKDQVVNLV